MEKEQAKIRSFNKKAVLVSRLQHPFVWRLIAGASTLLVSLLAYLSYAYARGQILENLKQSALIEVQQGVDEIDIWLAVRKAEIASITNTPTFRTMDWQQVGPYLEGELQRLPAFYHMTMISPDGSYYATGKGKTDKNVSDRHHIKQAFAGKTVASDPVISRIYGFPIILVVAPAWASQTGQGEIVGANGASISIDRLSEVVSKLEFGLGSYAFALNSKGQAIIHPNEKLLIFEKLTEHLGIIFVYEDMSLPIERFETPSSVKVEALGIMPSQWLEQLKKAAVIAKPGSILTIIEEMPKPDPILAAQLKQMVDNYQFSDIINRR